jgi:hypothetical protein
MGKGEGLRVGKRGSGKRGMGRVKGVERVSVGK